jgi:amino acid adenylation domain-containing protein
MGNISLPPHDLPPEQEALRTKCAHPSARFTEFPPAEIEQSIPARFEKIVRLHPGRLAVKAGAHSVSYEALNHAANRVASAILGQRGEKAEPIGLVLEQGVDIVTAILGILKAGKIYVPLDPAFPRVRNRDVLADAEPSLIVTNNTHCALAEELAGNKVVLLNIDELSPSVPYATPPVRVVADTLAYILYTSGSTGKPKGVVQNHRNILHLVMRHTNRAHISPQDRIALLRSFNVHGGTLLTFTALLNGAVLLLFDTKREGVQELAQWLTREEITLCRMGPTLFRHLAAIVPEEARYPHLRELSFSGEPLQQHDVELCRQRFSNECLVVNSFGATEVSSCCEYLIERNTRLEAGVVPCGYPTSDMEIVLLADDGREIPGGDLGEIAVKSHYLALEYWRQPQLTRAKFLPAPNGGAKRIYLTGDLGRILPDGRLVHLGRKDFQVKIRGYRVEVGEIESTLLTLDNLKEAVVVGQEDQAEELRLVAYVVPDRKPAPSTTTLRRALRESLPDYMVPAVFVLLDAMPLTPNGKIDRRALPVPDQGRPEHGETSVPPRTLVEEVLAEIWGEVLRVEQIGIHDNFFDLGGHSLSATRVMSRVRDAFQVEVSLRSLFEKPTLGEFAVVITQSLAKSGEQQNRGSH